MKLLPLGFSRADILAMSDEEAAALLRLMAPPPKPSSDSGGKSVSRIKSLRKPKPVT